mmetsp:Transcript_11281/g.17132  ORF Transcript_11281/g.17132 Transcript_11281/m.17132 type:complete len:222 (+) Transcript_11281:106-771(+)
MAVAAWTIGKSCSDGDFSGVNADSDWTDYESLEGEITAGNAPDVAAGNVEQMVKGEKYSKGNKKGLELKPGGGGKNNGRIFVGWDTTSKNVRFNCFNKHQDNYKKLTETVAKSAAHAGYYDIDSSQSHSQSQSLWGGYYQPRYEPYVAYQPYSVGALPYGVPDNNGDAAAMLLPSVMLVLLALVLFIVCVVTTIGTFMMGKVYGQQQERQRKNENVNFDRV